MLDKPKEFLKEVQNSEEYKKLDNVYLASAFTMKEGTWQLDFYSKERKILTSFKKENGQLVVTEDKLFQQKKEDPKELDLEECKISLTEALEKVEKTVNEKYPGNPAQKHIIILQNIDNQLTWNITILTETFKVINIKINAINGEVKSDKIDNLLSFKQ